MIFSFAIYPFYLFLALVSQFALSKPHCSSVQKHLSLAPQLQRVSLEPKSRFAKPTLQTKGLRKTIYSVPLRIQGRDQILKAHLHHALVKPSKGTIVLLCGGPGPCMDNRPDHLPADYDIAVSDYLGHGQNNFPVTEKDLSLEGQARAVKKMISVLPKGPYVIYGHSFGSAVATVLASELSKDPEQKRNLKSVILEAAVDKAATPNFPDAARKTWKVLTKEEKKAIQRTYQKFTKGLTSAQKRPLQLALALTLTHGPLSAADDLAEWSSIRLKEQNEAFIKKYASSVSTKNTSPSFLKSYLAGNCQILGDNNKGYRSGSFFGGLFDSPFVREVNLCDCRSQARDYDPKNFQIKVPVLYIQGANDPLSPLQGAKNHRATQTETQTSLLIVNEGGHFSTHSQLKKHSSCLFDSALSGDLSSIRDMKEVERNCTKQTVPPNESKKGIKDTQ